MSPQDNNVLSWIIVGALVFLAGLFVWSVYVTYIKTRPPN